MKRDPRSGQLHEVTSVAALCEPDAVPLQPLDIAACHGTGWTARAIRYGTASLLAPPRLRLGPSHVALMCEYHGRMLWIESTTLAPRPCAILGGFIEGCQGHLPELRILDYLEAGGRVDVYRLAPIQTLSQAESELLTTILVRHFVGQRVTYDLGGALISGTRLLKRTSLLPAADLNELFCSELVAAVLMRLGRMNHDNPTRYHPAGLLRELVRQGTYRFERSFVASSALQHASLN
ncbi:hypothetical protein Mal4_40220 [Maioricimonas rarisocia]|uniref:Uncharacterized protein n=1 Tax=Maioricimonas rarisocia TaxID=2528026 RepID=A0A517ZAZ6_9PLAN|nr:hypothetical protein [Maioricimonas rarisocia]QDU39676.1 hypothetical protein Mal4_40220 [Maioricimonas rarisocia]